MIKTWLTSCERNTKSKWNKTFNGARCCGDAKINHSSLEIGAIQPRARWRKVGIFKFTRCPRSSHQNNFTSRHQTKSASVVQKNTLPHQINVRVESHEIQFSSHSTHNWPSFALFSFSRRRFSGVHHGSSERRRRRLRHRRFIDLNSAKSTRLTFTMQLHRRR